jgi:hypothetical protein
VWRPRAIQKIHVLQPEQGVTCVAQDKPDRNNNDIICSTTKADQDVQFFQITINYYTQLLEWRMN